MEIHRIDGISDGYDIGYFCEPGLGEDTNYFHRKIKPIIQWCTDNCRGFVWKPTKNWPSIRLYFRNEEDATAFKLRWM